MTLKNVKYPIPISNVIYITGIVIFPTPPVIRMIKRISKHLEHTDWYANYPNMKY